MQLLVNDNAVELLKSQGKEVKFRTAKDNAEFYTLLKQKLLNDIEKMTSQVDAEKKVDFLIDAYLTIREFMTTMDEILNRSGRTMKEEIEKRKAKVGGFSKRIVIEEISKRAKDYSAEIAEIKKFGKENNYPSMNLVRNGQGQVYKTFLSGKDAWDEHVEVPINGSEEQFSQLLESVRRKDINEEQVERKT